uniref:G-protein coupled receptors family 1 profile domain-containing protein n=1 Tax=Zosterops lateralis melanops TaxID=1220523 RepID=A0A8D2PNB5_ZOSLA
SGRTPPDCPIYCLQLTNANQSYRNNCHWQHLQRCLLIFLPRYQNSVSLCFQEFAIPMNPMVSLWLLSTGVFCMPLYIPYSLTGKWHLGRGICKLWLVMDYLLCTASVFNIVLISHDRFLSVTKAVSYRAHQGITSNPATKMVAIWVLAFLLYCPAILFWEHVAGHSVVLEVVINGYISYTLCKAVFVFLHETWLP